jgi:putative ABC transport system permease protein
MERIIWQILEWWLLRRLPGAAAGPVIGDLLEEHAVKRGRVGPIRATIWLLNESLSIAVAYRPQMRATANAQRSAMEKLRSDVVNGARAISMRPAATIATVVVLGLGIGLVSAMFSLADPFLLRPLPYARPSELVGIALSVKHGPRPAVVPTLADWQARTDLFAEVGAYEINQPVRLTLTDGSIALRTASVSNRFFAMLGLSTNVPPEWADSAADSDIPLILTSAAPRKIRDMDQVFGRAFPRQEGGTLRVVGHVPPSFVFPRSGNTPIDGLVPLADQPLVEIQGFAGRVMSSRSLAVLARLRPGVTPHVVGAALSSHSEDGGGLIVTAESLPLQMTRRLRPFAFGALGAGVLILIVCAANVGNLLVARIVYRTREFATRQALGASRWDVSRLILAEIGLLAILGVAVGLTLTAVTLATCATILPREFAALGEPALTNRVVVFACIAGGAVMSAGLLPAWVAWRATPVALFTQMVRTDSRPIRALRFALASMQSALAVLLLVGATLLGRSYVNLLLQDPGFTSNSFVVSVSYPSKVVGAALQAQIDDTLGQFHRLPGVHRVAASVGSMIDGMRTEGLVRFNGEMALVARKAVTLSYFDAIGSAVIAGRSFTDRDGAWSAYIVNESFVRTHNNGTSPIGLMVTVGMRPVEIVGLVRDTHDLALDEPPTPTIFAPLQNPSTGHRISYVFSGTAERPPTEAIEQSVTAVNPEAIVLDGSTVGERLMRSIRDRSFATLVLGFFALAALGVSVAGLMGIVMYTVARRTREIAIRVAIGAGSSAIRYLVVREAIMAAAAGTILGLTASLWLSRTLESLLYGMNPADPLSIVITAIAVIGIVGLAAWLPARRAVRLSPTAALRID